MDITTKLYEEAMAGPVPSRPFGDDQTAGFDALVVGVLFVFFSHSWAGSVCVCVCGCVCVCVILGLAARFASGWRPLTPEVVNEILNDFLPCPVAFSDMA